MRLLEAEQVPFGEVLGRPFDLIVAASGFESRARHVAEAARNTRYRFRLALGFSDRHTDIRAENDRVFESLGYQLYRADGGTGKHIIGALEATLKPLQGESVTVMVDYSSMTRPWYAAVLRYFASEAARFRSAEIVFVYSPAAYSEPGMSGPNSVMEPIEGYCTLAAPVRDSALVIGLGYERDRALGLSQYVDPAETYAFYTDPGYDTRYVQLVKQNNAEIINLLGSEHVYSYPANDLHTTDAILTPLSLGLADRYRVILAPLGPKPFCLLCLLLATRFPDKFDVWRVSSGESSEAVDRVPTGEVIACRVRFGSVDPIGHE